MNAPSPTGLQGCWVDVNQPGNTSDPFEPGAWIDIYGSSAKSTASIRAARDAAASGSVMIPIRLSKVATYLRGVVSVWEGDTRAGTAAPGGYTYTDWSTGSNSYRSGLYGLQHCAHYPFGCDLATQYIHVNHLNSSGFKYIQALNPFQIVVVPVAMAQLKVLPYTIVYQPPGDQSKGVFLTSASFGVTMQLDNKGTSTKTTTVDNTSQISGSFGASIDIGDSSGKAAGTLGFSLSGAQKWDNSTKVGVGSGNQTTSGTGANFQTLFSMTVADSSLVPGTAGSYAAAPFWDDTFVLLVHPQFAFWIFDGVPAVSLLAARGSPEAPDLAEPTVRDLAACWSLSAPYAAGYPISVQGARANI